MEEKEKAAIDYARERLSNDDYPVYNDEYEIMLAFEAGAEWQYEQFENNRLSACDKQTKEEAEREEAFVISFIKENNRPPTFSDTIERTRKQTIEKACKWLKRNTILAETTIERFKQTMEE